MLRIGWGVTVVRCASEGSWAAHAYVSDVCIHLLMQLEKACESATPPPPHCVPPNGGEEDEEVLDFKKGLPIGDDDF
eukprot:9136275-Pyramimonas_sp.AAC.1